MSVELFRTVIPVSLSGKKISYLSAGMLLGSCFTENMGEKLIMYKFPVSINPFGITYNPLSVKKNLLRLISGRIYSQDELGYHGGVYFSFDHHSKFSDINKDACLTKINSSLDSAYTLLKKASHLFITFGTAYYYELKSNREIVNNCHKLPEKEFSRLRLQPDTIVREYSTLIPSLMQFNPDLKIVFTVSPIRHWKDGAHENQLSKSILFVAIDDICSRFDNCSYFPAYELMMDELRDYRFYEEDMIHPNKTAIDFIWKRFAGSFIDADTFRIMSEVEKIMLSTQHRPFNPGSDDFILFVKKSLDKIKHLTDQYPELDLTGEFNYFNSLLKKSIGN